MKPETGSEDPVEIAPDIESLLELVREDLLEEHRTRRLMAAAMSATSAGGVWFYAAKAAAWTSKVLHGWIGIGVLGAALTTGTALTLATPQAPRSDLTVQARPRRSGATKPQSNPVRAAPPVALVAPVQTPTPEAKMPAHPPAHNKTRSRDIGSSRQRAELAMLVHARALVHGAPHKSLALLERLEREQPQSILDEERDAVRIEALVGVGNLAAARAKLTSFFRDYPHSSMRRTLSLLVEPSNRGESNP